MQYIIIKKKLYFFENNCRVSSKFDNSDNLWLRQNHEIIEIKIE